MKNPTATASLQILKLVSEGMDIIAALRSVCGTENTNAMISDIYNELRRKEGR